MTFASGLAIYFVIWWLSLFLVLPFGVRTQHDANEVEPGTEPGAPVSVVIWKKFLWTTVVAGVIFGLYWFALEAGLTLDSIPFLRPPSDG
ncbi:putative secreted protein [Hartmannibacter diazotrophicus]|uniref:Putative secreted protein n=1 Tax=Hartmannibacter diazotrophicus TaxID=1482074 RepID=A0A2C9D416_9HYPH|nr:DUF1467 family protein [Hartmannibacter diazotrophicus]SON54929.1 putative secreted protein [Hartmannibacter diazotrophicus]